MTNHTRPQLAGIAGQENGGTYRLGVYDCCDDTIPVQFVGRTYDDSEFDRDVMALAISEYSHFVACREGCTYAMAVFRDSSPPTKTRHRKKTSVK
jgi:hypothetical protein